EDAGEGESTEEETAEGPWEDTNGPDEWESSDEGQSEGTDGGAEETEVQPKDYSGLMGEGEETTLESGTHEVGNDVPAGRYVITADTGIGNLFITNEEDMTVLSTTLHGEEEAQDYGSG